jgi:hypothetical protein
MGVRVSDSLIKILLLSNKANAILLHPRSNKYRYISKVTISSTYNIIWKRKLPVLAAGAPYHGKVRIVWHFTGAAPSTKKELPILSGKSKLALCLWRRNKQSTRNGLVFHTL